ncbi:MAG: type II toxin-antitoxin system VapC family toxin [Planctomycetota bacterium]
MGMETVYVETSIISYLTARTSRRVIVRARQELTVEWWKTARERFELFVSPLVLEEAGLGDEIAAAERLAAVEGLPRLEIVEEARELADKLIAEGAVPVCAQDDAAHIALAAVHAMNYLLTWNFRHLDNAETKPLIRSVCEANGYVCPEICTPEELMGEHDHA